MNNLGKDKWYKRKLREKDERIAELEKELKKLKKKGTRKKANQPE